MIAFLRASVNDVDRVLGTGERAECAAFACLIESKLNAAVLHATWCEWQSMRHVRVRPRVGG